MAETIMDKANRIKALAIQMTEMLREVEAGGMGGANVVEDHNFDHVPGIFQPFSKTPEVSTLRARQQHLHQEIAMKVNRDWGAPQGYDGVPTYQNTQLGDIEGVKSQLGHWQGQAAQNFMNNYVNRFDDYTQNLFVAIFVAAEAFGAEAKLWETAQKDIHSIADGTISALEKMPGRCLATGFELLLTSLPTVIDIGGKIQKGEKVALDVIKAIPGEGTKYASKSGSFKMPSRMIYEMQQAVEELKKNVKDAEGKIGTSLTTNKNYLVAHPDLFVAPGIAWGLAHSDDSGSVDGEGTLGQDDRPHDS